ncbi:MAG TPA: radical SAM protein [Vicinamibacteria bacterium]|nr:radical SAM protein [Vicinamibacteria bacterium]
MYDFANILFAGRCNRACPWCIGKALPDRVNVDNLSLWPLENLDGFIERVRAENVREIVFTGTVSDPHLYRHEALLLDHLRARLDPRTRYSIHTNGVLSLRKMTVFNRYDRGCISFPSFEPDTYEKMMGSRRVPDLSAILREATIPVKVSCVIDEPNVAELDGFVKRCHRIGVRRLVVRKLFGETREWDVLRDLPVVGRFKGNPVMDYRGMEVTYWDFDKTECRSLNLFPDGTIGDAYRLTETPQLERSA